MPTKLEENYKIYWDLAERFMDNRLNIIDIADFGDAADEARKNAGPRIAYLARRESEGLRIRLGLSERRGDAVYGAVVRRKPGLYEWQPTMLWPAKGELWERSDYNGWIPAKERKRRKAFSGIPSAGRASKEAPAVEPAPVTRNNSDHRDNSNNDNHGKIIGREGNSIVIAIDGKIIVAQIQTEVKASL